MSPKELICRFVCCLVVLGCQGTFGAALSQDRSDSWLTGPALKQRMQQSINIMWSETPLRQALEGLARSQNVAMTLDRRVDPSRKINLSVKDQTLEAVLQSIAKSCNLEMTQVGSLIYFGPPQAVAQLRALIDLEEKKIRRLSSAVSSKFQHTKEMAWDDLAEPRQLLALLGQESDLAIEGLEEVPHDLWPAADWPPLSLIDRLLLITSQFDLTFEAARDGRSITIVPAPENLENTARHDATQALRSKRVAEKKTSVKSKAGIGKADARTSPSQGGRTAQPASDDIELVRIDRLSVQEKPIGPVLRQLAERLHLELKMDEQAISAAGISLEKRVSIQVENATIDDIFRELLKTTGLTFQRTQRTVVITPAK